MKLRALYLLIPLFAVNLAFAQEAEILFTQGEKLCSDGKFSDAYFNFTKYLEYNPDSAKGYISRGNTAIFLNKISEAVRDFKKEIELQPDNYRVSSGLGEGNAHHHRYSR